MRDLYEDYLTEEQVADFLGITVKTLRNRIAARKDHPPVIKGINKFRKNAFEEWLQKRELPQFNRSRYK